MKAILMAATAACALFAASTAYACDNDRFPCPVASKHQAAPRHVHQGRRYAVAHKNTRRYKADYVPRHYSGGGLTTVPTAAGIAITVSTGIADKMTGLIADIVAHGYKPAHIGCYASGGHVSHSRHYSGNACDFDGSLSVAPFFRTQLAEDLIRQHGLHSGCDYVLHGVRDCGHIDDATWFTRRGIARAYAAYHVKRTYHARQHVSYRRYARK